MVLIIILAILAAVWILSYWWLNREVVGKVEVRNPGGDTGSALVVYHPGRGTFHPRVVGGFVEGLVASGWRVEVATASDQAPTELANYDLLVLGSPTYWFTPSLPIRRYLRKLGDLEGQPTVTIVTGLGAGQRSSRVLQGKVRDAHGNLVQSLTLYRMRPNDDTNYSDGKQNRALAVEMAKQVAQSLAPLEE
jgi:flavodoxin